MPMIPPAMVEISPWPPVPSSSPPQPPRRHRPDPQKDVFGYEPPEPEPSPHRDVLRWIQGLDLSHALRRVRRDVANGFVIAEIFSRYFPGEVEMHSYENGSSAHFKKDNWAQICRLSRSKGIDLPDGMVTAAMNSSPGAALALLECLYEFFTRRKLQRMTDLPDLTGGSDMTDMAPKKTQATYGEAAAESVLGGPKAISSGPAASAPVEFGQVNMRSVDDAMALRKNLGR